ncbi:MAG TPA: arginase family protein [Gemmatimonadales bacterium]|nr:arginase family protein [Gemmatimonadales bacterium]
MPPRPFRLLGAPTQLGLAPYPDGTARRVNEAPHALRARGLVARLGAEDLGDVAAPPYRDFARGALPIRHAAEIAEHAARLAERVAGAATPDARLLLVGGDCSILLGALLGLRRRAPGARVGLVFVDGHCDFAPPDVSRSGGAAGMDLALAVGAIDHPLARLAEDGEPLVRAEDVALLARKDLADEPHYGARSVRRSPVVDLPLEVVRAQGLAVAADRALERVARPGLAGFWIHFDVDVLRPELMPAVDSPEPDGLALEEAEELLARLLAHPGALGLEVTIYDPGLDPDGACGERLVALLERVARRIA